MPEENNVCTTTVADGLCVGCGVCAGICPRHNLVIVESLEGGYIPKSLGRCMASCSECLYVCPSRGHDVNEDSLGKILNGVTSRIRHRNETGYYLNTYVGYAVDRNHRWHGASGGLATWFLKTLLLKNIVDHVICVTPNLDPHNLFRFEILSHPDEILRSAKSAYYPVELSQAIRIVSNNLGRFALIGLPCFIKAVRLAALRNPNLQDRIVVYAGLTCGQLKTKGFAESLVCRMGLDPEKITHFCFRAKVQERIATNFSVTAGDGVINTAIDSVGFYHTAWITGMFKLRACNFCDDVYAELADISFMDAWLSEYSSDSAGTNLVITRSALADRIIQKDAIKNGCCVLRDIPIERVIESQLDVISFKRDMLGHRLWVEAQAGRAIPQKRAFMRRPNLLDWLIILNAEALRTRSFTALCKQRESNMPTLTVFMKDLRRDLFLRKWLCRLKNLHGGLMRRIERAREAILRMLSRS